LHSEICMGDAFRCVTWHDHILLQCTFNFFWWDSFIYREMYPTHLNQKYTFWHKRSILVDIWSLHNNMCWYIITRIYILSHTNTHVYIYIYIHIYVCMYIDNMLLHIVEMLSYIVVYSCMNVYIYVLSHTNTHVYIRIDIYMCIYIYTYI